jgi:hypothetical protein
MHHQFLTCSSSGRACLSASRSSSIGLLIISLMRIFPLREGSRKKRNIRTAVQT